MTVNRIRALLFTALVGCASTLASSPALAFRPDEGYLTTYYSDSTQTVEIGWKMVGPGSCGKNYDTGVHSPYFTMEVLNCKPPPPSFD